jgi:hypothetical protein
MAILMSFNDGIFKDSLEAFCLRVKETNSRPLEKHFSYMREEVPVHTYYFVAYEGLVLKIFERYCSSMDMSHYEAVVADVKDGKRVYKTVGICSSNEKVRFPNKVDASPELIKEYEIHLAYLSRKHDVLRRYSEHRLMMKQAREAKLTFKDVKNLRQVLGSDRFPLMMKLLASHAKGRLRSKFRESLAQQTLRWVNNPTYKTPLSNRQLDYL